MVMETGMALTSDGESKDPPRKRVNSLNQSREHPLGHRDGIADVDDSQEFLTPSSSDTPAGD